MMVVFGEWAQVETVELINDGSGLAFGIVGGRSSGVVIKTILPGGVADRDGRLKSGDRLVRVGRVRALGMCARQAAAVLRQCGTRVRLLVARPANIETEQPLSSGAPVVPSRLLADPDELDRHLQSLGYDTFNEDDFDSNSETAQNQTALITDQDVNKPHQMRPVTSLVAIVPNSALSSELPAVQMVLKPAVSVVEFLPLDMAVREMEQEEQNQPETKSFEVILTKDSKYGLGITVAGYVCEQEELSGIFVKSISAGSSADLSNKIKVNDRIVEVDGTSLHDVSNHRAVSLLRDSPGPRVRLRALRYLRGQHYERLRRALATDDAHKQTARAQRRIDPPSPSVTSLPKYNYSVYDESTVIEPELDSDFLIQPNPTPSSPCDDADVDTAAGVEIVLGADAEDADAEVRAVQDKWRDILEAEQDWPEHDDGYDIIVGTVVKEPGGTLGVSLEGTMRVEGGRDVNPRHYIRALAPGGAVESAGVHRVGDELLEVNGVRLLGLHHSLVVRTLIALQPVVRLVCARRRRSEEGREHSGPTWRGDRANLIVGSLQNLQPSQCRLIKAKSESSIGSLCSTNTQISANNSEFNTNDLDKNKSRSLEPLSGLAMWSDEVQYIDLVKEDRGLGFSILDYLDPSSPGSSAIVVRALVIGGAASLEGGLAPGDRLISVNGRNVAREPLAVAVQAIKTAPKGIVTIGIAKPLPCTAVANGDGNNSISSQECIYSLASDDHTGFDSFHECLQEYQEGLEVVQICMEPEDQSLNDEASAFEDLSLDEYRKEPTKLNGVENNNKISSDEKFNVNLNNDGDLCAKIINSTCNDLNTSYGKLKSYKIKMSKSEGSLEDPDDDMTLTEDEPEETPRDLPDKQHYVEIRSRSADNKIEEQELPLSKNQSRDISTSDEMVFAVTPTGLERISFEKYWKGCANNTIPKVEKIVEVEQVKSVECWKNNSMETAEEVTPETPDENVTWRLSIRDNSSFLYIDHDVDGYETCIDDGFALVKSACPENVLIKNGESLNIFMPKPIECEPGSDVPILCNGKLTTLETLPNKDCATKQEKPKDDSISSKQMEPDNISIKSYVSSIHESELQTSVHSFKQQHKLKSHIITQMRSLKIEPLNINITNVKKSKRHNETKNTTNNIKEVSPKHEKRFCVEYYNDQAECLEEYNRQKDLEEKRKKHKTTRENVSKMMTTKLSKNILLKKQEPSEESTDQEGSFPVPGCHKCFLENYAYELTKAYIESANSCKFCDVIREILEPPKRFIERSLSAPALLDIEQVENSETDDEDYLMVPVTKDRRQSAGPLRFLLPLRESTTSGDRGRAMTVCGGEQRWGSSRSVVLTRPNPNASLGITIVGGKVDIVSGLGNGESETGAFGIFVKSVIANSPAGVSGQLHTGDRILEVDGVCVRGAPHDQAVKLIKAAGEAVKLTVQSLLALPPEEEATPPSRAPRHISPSPSIKVRAPTAPPPQIQITVSDDVEKVDSKPEEPKQDVVEPPTPDPVKPKIVYSDDEDSDDDDDDEEDRRDLEGRTYSDQGVEIDRASAAAIKRSKEEKEADPEQEDEFGYTSNKIRKKYSGLGDQVVCVRLERSARGALGLALAGHRDRAAMAVFVCGLHPSGSAAKSIPPIKVGDEILEVNGIVLHGRCHLNASAIIKGLAGPVFRVILLRRKQALEDVAVKPLTQFPVELEEESADDIFSSYKGVHHVSIRKGSASLGIMIIEGRHAEVGQGIFISDIQENSAAEQAGLQIGDMILAVNKDSLLGASYDSAASLLKKTEGVVVLTVCNPNTRGESPTPPDDPSSRLSVGAAQGGQTPAKVAPTPAAKPPPSPAHVEPPADPFTAPIVPGKDNVIVIATNNASLGITLVGGSDTLVTGGAIVLEVYPGGAAGKDGRLVPGDQLMECNGIKLTKEMSHERLCLTVKQTLSKIKLVVFRQEKIEFTDVEVELVRKPGKGMGLCFMGKNPPPGVFVSDILPGSSADLDGRLQRGDIVCSVDGKDLTSATQEDAAAAIKSVTGKGNIKIKRYKVVR